MDIPIFVPIFQFGWAFFSVLFHTRVCVLNDDGVKGGGQRRWASRALALAVGTGLATYSATKGFVQMFQFAVVMAALSTFLTLHLLFDILLPWLQRRIVFLNQKKFDDLASYRGADLWPVFSSEKQWLVALAVASSGVVLSGVGIGFVWLRKMR